MTRTCVHGTWNIEQCVTIFISIHFRCTSNMLFIVLLLANQLNYNANTIRQRRLQFHQHQILSFAWKKRNRRLVEFLFCALSLSFGWLYLNLTNRTCQHLLLTISSTAIFNCGMWSVPIVFQRLPATENRHKHRILPFSTTHYFSFVHSLARSFVPFNLFVF